MFTDAMNWYGGIFGSKKSTKQATKQATKAKKARKNPRRRSKFPLFIVQTIEVPKKYPLIEARAIAERHGGRLGGKVDSSANFWRFRQHDPKLMSKRYVSLKLQHAIIVKALPKATARKAKVSDSTKPLTAAELKRLWALQDSMKGKK
jgi:hypothetical protein